MRFGIAESGIDLFCDERQLQWGFFSLAGMQPVGSSRGFPVFPLKPLIADAAGAFLSRSPMNLLRFTAVKASWPITRRLVSESSQRASLLRQFESVADVGLRLYDGRGQIDQLIAFDSPPVIGEIGIFEGDFAKFLINRYQPAEMHLFDLFRTAESICSGDCDGNNVRLLSGEHVYRNAISAFGSDPRVRLHEGDSKSTVRSMPDDHFDLIYIDGDHNYQGCLADLLNCYEKVKHSGWIAGHDIAINPRRCRSYQKFGVRRAVLDFCKLKSLPVSGLFNDGCVSYAIRVNKQTSTQTGAKVSLQP